MPREPKVKRKFFTSPIDPFVTSDVSDAQNCGKTQICHFADRPFRHFGRAKLFFFLPMPCALEALTVINPLFRLSLSKGETITKVSQSPNKNQTKHHKANKTQKQTGHLKGEKHYAFRNFSMPLSTAPQRNSKYLS